MDSKIWVVWQQQPHQGPEPRFLGVVGINMTPGIPIHMREAFAREVMAAYAEVAECECPTYEEAVDVVRREVLAITHPDEPALADSRERPLKPPEAPKKPRRK